MSALVSKKMIAKMRERIGFSDLLGYAAIIKDNIVALKDGSLQAVFRFYGDDVQSMMDDMSVAYAMRWSQAVASLWTDNIIVETDVVRREAGNYSDALTFPDVVTALIDQERHYQFENAGALYESMTYITITWRDQKELSAKTKKFIYNTEDQAREKTPQERLLEFESKLRQFIKFVSFGRDSKFKQLAGDELVTFLRTCIDDNRTVVAAPSQNTFLDFYLAKQDFLPGHQPQVGNKYIKALTIDQYPTRLHPMMMHMLNTLSVEFRYHTRFVLLSKKQASKILKSIQTSWSSKAIGFKGVIVNAFGGQAKLDAAAEEKNLQTEMCIAENEDGQIKYGLYNATFILFDEDLSELNRKVADFTDYVQNLGFVLRDEKVNATEAYLGSLPGHGNANVRINPFDSVAWADMLPLSSIYAGEATCPNPLYPENSPPLFYAVTDDTNVYRYNGHVGDVGHTFTIGPTGGGKTTLHALIAAQHRKYPNSRYIALDKDNSHRVSILAMGGVYYDPNDIETEKIAVFSHINDKYGFELAHKWLCDTFSINGVAMTSVLRKEVRKSLERLSRLKKEHRKFTNLEFQEKSLRDTFNELRGSMFGQMVDGTDDKMFTHDVFGIDIGAILRLDQVIAAPIIKAIIDKLTYLFKDKRPTRLLLEEAWKLLEQAEFASEIKDWFRTLRKFVVGVDFVSQTLSDVTESEIANIILESCPTKIYLPNREATNKTVKEHYSNVGLNEKEIELISGATPKRHYYVKQPLGSRLIDLGLGDVALSFLGVAGDAEVALFDEHYSSNDPTWITRYLRVKGFDEAAKFVEEYYVPSEGEVA